ncbi:MAG: hypothetical protein AUI14_02445 [Actinobacteria bacterium 13_2_20CM_2_71_6]|nr:MAG: hypothetical protein AUI14_02445 [Actinobacteria bacterium 13_2_20CM_2_71_6]
MPIDPVGPFWGYLMRALRGLAAGLSAIAGGLAVAVGGAPAMAAPVFGGLTLDPQSGKADTTITATFQVTDRQGGNCKVNVTFRWSGHTVGQDKSNGCTASIRFKAPRNDRDVGAHQVSAVDATSHQVGVAIFTVTVADSTTDPTATPTKTRSARPTSSATDLTALDPPLPTEAAPPSLDAVGGTASPLGTKRDSALSTWALAFGGILVLGGVSILVLVVMRMRGGDPEPEHGAPLGEFPTQVIPVGAMADDHLPPPARPGYPLDHGDSQGPGSHYGRHPQ